MPKPPSAESLLKKFKAKTPSHLTPIASNLFIPNHSGDHSFGMVRNVPSEEVDIANKKYVDDTAASLIATHTADDDAHHAKYTNAEAVAAVAAADHYVKNTGDTITGSVSIDSGNLNLNDGNLYIKFDQANALLFAYAYGTNKFPSFSGRASRGSRASPSASLSGDYLFKLGGAGYGASAFGSANRAMVVAQTTEDWTNTAQGASISFLTSPNGSAYAYTRLTIDHNGRVGIGTTTPAGALDVSSTTGGFIVPRMTTAQIAALTPVNGMIVYDTTLNAFYFYENDAWVTGSGLA